MPIERVDVADNPTARGTWTWGRQDGPTGLRVDSEGNLSVAGDLAVTGSITAVPGIAAADPYGLAAATIDLPSVAANYNLSSGVMVACAVIVPAGPVAMLGTMLTTAGITSTGANRMGLYDIAGTLIDITAPMTAEFQATPPVMIQEHLLNGTYTNPTTRPMYIAALTHFTSAPTIGGSAAVPVSQIPPLNGVYPTIFLTGQTALPSSFSPASAQQNNAWYFLFARSNP